jgi:osmoprotectant transport system permease protein
VLALAAGTGCRRADVRVGSKSFEESTVLAEMAAHLARDQGKSAEHRNLGGTRVLWEALLAGYIDVYPEYTGTIAAELLPGSGAGGEEGIRQALAAKGLRMTASLGFENKYALGMPRALADELRVTHVSDLRRYPDLKIGFSNEFLNRADGWPGLAKHYRLPQSSVQGLEHALTYPSLKSGSLAVTDLYTTDAEIVRDDVLVLQEDDPPFFPPYHAVLLYRADLAERVPAVVEAFRRLEGAISEEEMRTLNAAVKYDQRRPSQVAADFLTRKLHLVAETGAEGLAMDVGRRTVEHLFLVGVSLAAAVAVAVPLGVLAAKRRRLGHAILGVVGVLQTIPSLALLVLLIPLPLLGGIGAPPAIVALFLYSLLPVVRNTYTGLHDISPSLRESAEALGLPPFARLRLVELPLAARSILAGIKTAAVINVGTATLGALIGAGGYGEPILEGVRLYNFGLLLEGAVPAALLALAVQGLFELADRWFVPRGLRLPKAE